MKLADAAHDFLGSTRIAVTGVSRNPQGHGSNTVYERLLERGYDVFPVNPHATEIAGHPCYPDLATIPGGVQAVVIGTRPEHALGTVKEAADLGIEARAQSLMQKANETVAQGILAAKNRLIGGGRGGMGTMFKVIAMSDPSLTALVGFGDQPDPEEATPS